jgi:hypothetical protein
MCTKQTTRKSVRGSKSKKILLAKKIRKAALRIQPHCDWLMNKQFEDLIMLEFRKPQLREYKMPDSDILKRYHISVYKGPKFLGYLPMPKDYCHLWVQLCYNIVYAANVFCTAQKMCKEKAKKHTDRL